VANASLMHQMVCNQLRQGLMMLNNEEIVRELCAAADGSGKETQRSIVERDDNARVTN
jgi:hypothetical protein